MSRHGMQNLEDLYIRKLEKRIDEIGTHAWSDAVPFNDVAMAETKAHLSLAEARRLPYRQVRPGRQWGKPWSTAWFRLRGRVPRAFRGQPVSLLFNPEGECVVFHNGEPVQGLDPNREDVLLYKRARGGERVELYVEAGASSAFGRHGKRTMHEPRLAVFNEDVWDAWHDASALFDLARAGVPISWSGKTRGSPPQRDTRSARLIFTLNKAVDLFDYHDTARDALRRSGRRVRRALRSAYACRAHDSAQTIACLGHAHIDVAWLWPLAETVRKCGRTFSNVLACMDRYPEFVFCQSQPQLYEFTRDRYPSLYRKIKQRARKGQWIPTGCMWVEADCNVSGGESLVRQILFGTRFFRKEFNHQVACLWLPDVFGYCASLPQLLKRSGIDYFLTIKISWSQFNKFPHNTFYWEGLDGSRVLAHFPPSGDYNSRLAADQMLRAERDYQEKDRSPLQAIPFGFGDGGGGPTPAMLERRRRYHDLEGMPKLRPMPPERFFQRLENQSTDLRTYVGELYLELHRATLTTQSHIKRNNRKAECLLRDTEILWASNLPARARYPQDNINDAWKTVLLNQFHDIIPGSSITRVYEDSANQFRALFQDIEPLRDKGLARYAKGVDTRGPGRAVLLFNTLGWERTDVAALKIPGLQRRRAYKAVAPDGGEIPVQLGSDGYARFRARLPSLGHAVYHIVPGRAETARLQVSERGMENDRLRIRLDARGRVRSIYDKVQAREILAPRTTGNQLILFEDKPAAWDAWDIDIFYNDKALSVDGELLSVRAIEKGPVRGVIRVRRAISHSTVTQDIVLDADSSRLDFVTTVDWGEEKDVLLKAAFPVNIRSQRARYDIQFGSVERPTHWNTPKDFAQFEVAAHKWADLSEGDSGVALLNDCKYGYDVRDNVMRISLLRAPKSPDPSADVNKQHCFTYSILPHGGDYRNGVVRAGYELNVPLLAGVVPASRGKQPAEDSLLAVTGDNVVIETMKKAEDDRGLIVRLYEAHGCRGQRTLRTSLPVRRVVETDLMEKEERRLTIRSGRVRLNFRPFQIRTLKLVL